VHSNGAEAWERAEIGHRLGGLFDLRLRIYLADPAGEAARGELTLASEAQQLAPQARDDHELHPLGHRLGGLFDLRLRIYRRKFMVKFLNNLLAQMTPPMQ
jgi:hypothetical protein